MEGLIFYAKARSQVRVSPMGDIIGLDYGAIAYLMHLEGYTGEREKELFTFILTCFNLEREFNK